MLLAGATFPLIFFETLYEHLPVRLDEEVLPEGREDALRLQGLSLDRIVLAFQLELEKYLNYVEI